MEKLLVPTRDSSFNKKEKLFFRCIFLFLEINKLTMFLLAVVGGNSIDGKKTAPYIEKHVNTIAV
jgi:hypothetical protein